MRHHFALLAYLISASTYLFVMIPTQIIAEPSAVDASLPVSEDFSLVGTIVAEEGMGWSVAMLKQRGASEPIVVREGAEIVGSNGWMVERVEERRVILRRDGERRLALRDDFPDQSSASTAGVFDAPESRSFVASDPDGGEIALPYDEHEQRYPEPYTHPDELYDAPLPDPAEATEPSEYGLPLETPVPWSDATENGEILDMID